jgi:hypothetical protein
LAGRHGGSEYLLGTNVNVAAVFDNLIYKQEMPVTIGLFVNPGDKGLATRSMAAPTTEVSSTIHWEMSTRGS